MSQIEVFVALSEELHFRRAAERLLTQASTVSTAIKALERELWVTLFERTSRKVVLTPAGERFGEHARQILRSAEQAKQQASAVAHGDDPFLAIGLHDEGAAELNQLIADRWRAAHPNGALMFHEINYRDLEVALADSRVDCLLITAVPNFFAEPEQVDITPLYDEQRVLVVAADSPLADRASVSVDEALSLTYLDVARTHEPLTRFFCNHDLRDTSGDVKVDAESLGSMFSHIASGEGVITVTDGVRRFYGRPDIAYVPVPGLPPGRVSIVRRIDDERPHVVAAIDAASRVVDDHLDMIPRATPVPT